MKVGLRVDACTFRGTKIGIPKLCENLEQHSIKGSFFFSMGPDNMGRHIRRLIRPSFISKIIGMIAPCITAPLWEELLL